jgi:hypothetical protein
MLYFFLWIALIFLKFLCFYLSFIFFFIFSLFSRVVEAERCGEAGCGGLEQVQFRVTVRVKSGLDYSGLKRGQNDGFALKM